MKNFVNLEKLDSVTSFLGTIKNQDNLDHFLILRMLSLNEYVTKNELKKIYRITEKRITNILNELKDYINIENVDKEDRCSLSLKGIKLCRLTMKLK